MEPTLRQGDIVLVRKADGGLFPRLLKSLVFGSNDMDITDGAAPPPPFVAAQPEPTFARLYERPPKIQRGQVIVLKSVDTAFPDEWHIKRVWGTPGTWVTVENGRYQPNPSDQRRVYRKLQGVPTHSLYVGGDNEDCSRDSRHYGPVSQNLVVGVAEYIVWPPTRIQKITPHKVARRSVPIHEFDSENA